MICVFICTQFRSNSHNPKWREKWWEVVAQSEVKQFNASLYFGDEKATPHKGDIIEIDVIDSLVPDGSFVSADSYVTSGPHASLLAIIKPAV